MDDPHSDLNLQLPWIQLSLSLMGLVLVAAFTLFLQPEPDVFWRRSLVGLIYGLVCVLGIVAVYFPARCRRIVFKAARSGVSSFVSGGLVDDSRATRILGLRFVHGHHPSCDGFRGHEIWMGGKSFCAGCTGLFLGAVVALLGVAFSFFGGVVFAVQGEVSVFLGMVGVAIGLLQSSLYRTGSGWFRVFTSALFVVGTFLILYGIDVVLRNLSLDLAVILFSLLWLATRIGLSQLNHSRICGACGLDCKKGMLGGV